MRTKQQMFSVSTFSLKFGKNYVTNKYLKASPLIFWYLVGYVIKPGDTPG